MPFRLCNCDKVKLNRVIDQVKALSKTVDDLREEIDSLKTCFAEESSDDETLVNCESYEKKGDNIGALRRLKKCLEKNVIPIISRDTGYRVKKKCQQFFSQSPQIVRCPARFSFQESSLRQSSASPFSTKKNYRKHVSCQTPESNVKRMCQPSAKKTSKSTRKCIKNLSNEPKKCTTVPTTSSTDSLSSSRGSRLKKSRSYKLCETEKSFQPYYCVTKSKKTTGAATSISAPKKCTWEKNEVHEKYPSRCRNKIPSVNYVEKRKCVAAVVEESSTSSCQLTSKTSIDHIPPRKIIYGQSKKRPNEKLKLRNVTNDEKLTLPQCSPDCLYVKAPKSSPRDISTNTFTNNVAQDDIYKNKVKKKNLESQETQTFLKSNEIEDFRHCESFISLTSCSPMTINYFPVKTNNFEEETSPIIRHSTDQGKITFEMKRVCDPTGNGNTCEEANIVSTNWNEGEPSAMSIAELPSDQQVTNNRLKRTYVISPEMPSTKNDRKVNQDFVEQHENLSSTTTCQKLDDNNILRSNCKKRSKEEQLRRTVCTNRPKRNYLLKFPLWSRKKSKKTPPSSKKVVCPARIVYDSASPPELSEESCSLTSNCNFSKMNMLLVRK